MSIHNCNLIEFWSMDERVPVQLDREAGTFLLFINAETVITAVYCPFCGERLDGNRKAKSLNAGVCEHIKLLASRSKSSIKYLPNEMEFFIVGLKNVKARLFFCPICGKKLPLHEPKLCHKSALEMKKLKKIFENVDTIEQTIALAGEPDFEGGPTQDHLFWKGKRLDVGIKRALLYTRLAKTIDVHVAQWSDGKFDVKFQAKTETV